jgi:hypothetical protein
MPPHFSHPTREYVCMYVCTPLDKLTHICRSSVGSLYSAFAGSRTAGYMTEKAGKFCFLNDSDAEDIFRQPQALSTEGMEWNGME